MTDAESRLTTDGYDTLSRLTSVTNTAIQSTPLLQESYSPNGRLASLTDALGHATSFAYDGLDRLGTTTYPGGSTEVLGYDNDSNVTSLQTRAGATIQYGYDNLNRRSSKTPPSPAPVVTYSYDLADRLTGVSDTSAAIPTVAVPGGGSGVQYTSYFYYDQINRLTGTVFDSVSAVTAPASSSVVFNHWYNKVNQRTYQTVNDNSYWDYPAASASSVSYGANTLNQYTAVGSATPSYDGNGNLTGDGTFTYGYDAENRLTSASGAGNTASYGYDASGRRKSKTVNGTSTYYLSDGDREVLEYDGSGNVLRRYTHGDGIDEVLNLVDVSGSRALLVPDIQGSLVASVDSTSGTITKQANLAYGESADTSGSFRYTGRRIDAETLGLYYYRARMYHPTLGRFMQPDPIGYAGGANLYAYVGNDPLNWLDPFGLEPAHADTGGSLSGSWGLTSWIHGGLTALSFCPSICGSAFALADSGVYALHGDWSGAGISALAAVAGTISDAGAAKLVGLGLKAGVDGLDVTRAARGGVYALRDAEGAIMRTRRTGDLARRAAEHARDPLLKDFRFDPVHQTDVYAEQRGLEQMLHDAHNPPFNKINPIRRAHRRYDEYMNAARDYLNRTGQ